MKIGIVGSGIAGLVAAYRLEKQGHTVTLFEAGKSLGMAAHGVQFEENGRRLFGDVPSRMLNSYQWPNLYSLYRELGVETCPVDSTQSFSDSAGTTYLRLHESTNPLANLNSGNLLRRGRTILNDAKRLLSDGASDLDRGIDTQLTLASYLAENQYSDSFVYDFLYPTLSSTVCTCSYESLKRYPASVILNALRNIAGTRPGQLLRTRFGTGDVTNRIAEQISQIHRQSSVQRIQSDSDHVRITTVNGGESNFEFAICAIQANHAHRIVSGLNEDERACLANFRYEDVPVVIHRDASFMPKRKIDWSTFNMFTSDDLGRAMCTVWMNRFHPEWGETDDCFQTINPIRDPEPDSTIRKIVLQRPVVTFESFARWQHLKNRGADKRQAIQFCGSYASPGIPLLETGVVSANQVADQICRNLIP